VGGGRPPARVVTRCGCAAQMAGSNEKIHRVGDSVAVGEASPRLTLDLAGGEGHRKLLTTLDDQAGAVSADTAPAAYRRAAWALR
jgi:hypothetical protein